MLQITPNYYINRSVSNVIIEESGLTRFKKRWTKVVATELLCNSALLLPVIHKWFCSHLDASQEIKIDIGDVNKLVSTSKMDTQSLDCESAASHLHNTQVRHLDQTQILLFRNIKLRVRG